MSTRTMLTGVRLDALVHFRSTGLTGTGAQVSIPHGLGYTPALVIPVLADTAGGATYNLSQAADDVNIYINVTNGATYSVLAL